MAKGFYTDDISQKRIDLLHPYIREDVRKCISYINNVLLKDEIKIRITQGLRTFEEQDELYKQVPKVTNAKAGSSYHNYGLAFDICLLDVNNKSVSWEINDNWMIATNYLKSKGYQWGGDFTSFIDKPHFEKTFGYSVSRLLAKYNSKEFIEGTNYLRL